MRARSECHSVGGGSITNQRGKRELNSRRLMCRTIVQGENAGEWEAEKEGIEQMGGQSERHHVGGFAP